MDYSKHVTSREDKAVTPQSEKIPGKKMKKNSAGGFVFKVNDWDRLDRFLILGTEGGTYYIGEKKLTRENAKVIEKLLKQDGVRVVTRTVEISDAGRAAKNDAALFVLALAAAADDPATRKAALNALPKVARIGTHLFHFAQYVQSFRGWGRGLRKAIGRWYNDKSMDDLEYQVIKYKQRDGWSHRDLLRLAHPVTTDESRNSLYKFVVSKEKVNVKDLSARMQAAEQIATETSAKKAVKLITDFNLPREVVNTELLQNKEIWEALLAKMPVGAMIRNLGKMTAVGILDSFSDGATTVINSLGDVQRLQKARIHPLAVLAALRVYANGHGEKGSLSWNPNTNIVDALDRAFYDAFKAIEPTGKRLLLALDVSGSMTSAIPGLPFISCRDASAVMAMVTAVVEKQWLCKGFTAGAGKWPGGYYANIGKGGSMSGFVDLNISPRMRLDTIIQNISNLPFGGTDCSLPMVWAEKNKVPVDAFVVYTDNESWQGPIHASQALTKYRQCMGIPSKMIVVAMTSNGFSIADSDDLGSLDVVGFDIETPNIISNFVRS
jgi:60 kDa SS-A/Ro ribonucleoprotein